MTKMQEEEQRQTQMLTDLIYGVIKSFGQQVETPILNSVAAALVSVEASILGAIQSPEHRKALRRAMEKGRPIALREALKRKAAMTVEAVVIDRNRINH